MTITTPPAAAALTGTAPDLGGSPCGHGFQCPCPTPQPHPERLAALSADWASAAALARDAARDDYISDERESR